MAILITGAAGFIGFHTARALLSKGHTIIGVDNMNDYYDPTLKHARLRVLHKEDGFRFIKLDFAQKEELFNALAGESISHIIHLGAQAGVRYSIDNPDAYTHSNLVGHMNILELARDIGANTGHLPHMVYASSSSVYGGNTKLPFSIEDKVDTPVSLYAATKKSNELMSHAYSHLFRLPLTGLRFFTVYGPWGRPDMAYWMFTDKIINGAPIKVFNNGDMGRDFTYIKDIVWGIAAAMKSPPSGDNGAPHAVYNLGNNQPERLTTMINILEDAIGKKAEIDLQPMQPGDVKETFADISETQRDFGYQPRVSLAEGLPKFVEWYRDFYGV